MKIVIITGSFDDLRSRPVRLLEEAAKSGRVRVLLWPDETMEFFTGKPPLFSEMERLYMVRAMRFVDEAEIGPPMKSAHVLTDVGLPGNTIWAVLPEDDHPVKRSFCAGVGITLRVIPESDLAGFPVPTDDLTAPSTRKK